MANKKASTLTVEVFYFWKKSVIFPASACQQENLWDKLNEVT